jgi:hypothetical protein
MIRTLIVAGTLVMATGTLASAPGAPSAAPRAAPMAAPAGAPWRETAQSIATGSTGSGDASPSHATPPPAFLGPPVSKGEPQQAEPWHNTVHPIPAGSGGDSTPPASPQQPPITKSGTQPPGDAPPWHDTVHPIPAGQGNPKNKNPKTRHHRHHHHRLQIQK